MKFKVGDWIRTKESSTFFGAFEYEISAAFIEDGQGVYKFNHQEQYFEAKRIDEYYDLVSEDIADPVV